MQSLFRCSLLHMHCLKVQTYPNSQDSEQSLIQMRSIIVPSNWIMKRYVRPSVWLATLLGAWGVFTIGFAGVQTYAQVVVLRFFIGVFEAVSEGTS